MLLFIALSLEFRRTLKIIAKMLREVVNRDRLGGTNAAGAAPAKGLNQALGL